MNIIKGNNLFKRAIFIIQRLKRRISNKGEIKVIGNDKNQLQQLYVINLDRQEKRWEEFQKEAKSQKINGNRKLLEFCTRISAIDGQSSSQPIESLDISSSYRLSNQYYVDPDPRLLSAIRKQDIKVSMTKEEVAVSLSHIKAWRTLIQQNRAYALILEDDIYFETEFAEGLNQIWNELIPGDTNTCTFDLLYLSFREVEHGYEKRHFSKSLNISVRGLWWLSGYVLSLEGARKLLNELPVEGPIDLWMNLKFNKLRVYSAKRSIISQRIDFNSDNSYSILPVLSQIGIQSDKTHLELEQKKGRNPVFVIDFCWKSAVNVGYILSMSGYRCCINKWNEFDSSIEKIIDNLKPLLFDAYVGFDSIYDNYEVLEGLYPEALFILVSGSKNVNSKTKSDTHKVLFDKVSSFFEDKEDKFLLINEIESIDWNEFGFFLQCQLEHDKLADFKLNGFEPPDIDLKNYEIVEVSDCTSQILQHDVHPWIIPINNLENYGVGHKNRTIGRLIGEFKKVVYDDFKYLDKDNWRILENSFPSNLAQFSKENISILKGQGLEMKTLKKAKGKKEYSSASIVTSSEYLFGKFEVEMKPIKSEGIITAFFLHRNDPWQEIDFEFLGNDTTKFLTNIYYNPGHVGSNNNFGNRGTPITIKLGFDASESFHKYAIEWSPHEIRWYVDGKLVHVRANWEPTPIPDLPMQFFLNTWPTISEELAGNINNANLPKCTLVKNVGIYTWSKS
nr:family 16 glycosylhydrolase [Allomuricauda sp.]